MMMKTEFPITFGKLLWRYRMQTNGPPNGKSLSQEQLAERVHLSAATICYWETDQRRIDVQDRATLLLLLEVLSQHGGIRSVAAANVLLEAGDYRSLNAAESARLQPFYPPTQAAAEAAEPPPPHISLGWLAVLFRSDAAPDESRLAALVINWLGYPAELITPEGALRLMGLGALWVIAAWSWLRLFHWPYADQAAALRALLPWVAASILIPVVLGLIIRADRQAFLEQKTGKRSYILFHRVIGAMLGYMIGAAFVFVIGLTLYYLGFWPPARSITMALAAAPLLLAYAAGRRTPYNSFRAYHDSRGEADALRPDSGGVILLLPGVIIPVILASVVYVAPEIFLNRLQGPLLIAACLFVMLAWKVKNKQRSFDDLWTLMIRFFLGIIALTATLLGVWMWFLSAKTALAGSAVSAVAITAYLVFLENTLSEMRLLPTLAMVAVAIVVMWLQYLHLDDAAQILLIAAFILWLIIYRRNFRAWVPLIAALLMLFAALALFRLDVVPAFWLRIVYAFAAAGLVVWQLRRARSRG